MINFDFFKYNSNGNDFIIVDETKNFYNFSQDFIKKLCSRQFSIGADGLVLLQNSKNAHFKMKIFNSDGLEANMCGNALLCINRFIYDHIVKQSKFLIETKAAIYETFVDEACVSFKSEIPKIISENNEIVIDSLKFNFPVIDSGVLHGVIFLDKIDNLDVFNLGKKIRNFKSFLPQGINVNFCEKISENEIKIRTYERGVEAETLSCSTGSLAVAFEIYRTKKIKVPLNLFFRGGKISISIEDKTLRLTNNPSFAFKGSTNFFD